MNRLIILVACLTSAVVQGMERMDIEQEVEMSQGNQQSSVQKRVHTEDPIEFNKKIRSDDNYIFISQQKAQIAIGVAQLIPAQNPDNNVERITPSSANQPTDEVVWTQEDCEYYRANNESMRMQQDAYRMRQFGTEAYCSYTGNPPYRCSQ